MDVSMLKHYDSFIKVVNYFKNLNINNLQINLDINLLRAPLSENIKSLLLHNLFDFIEWKRKNGNLNYAVSLIYMNPIFLDNRICASFNPNNTIPNMSIMPNGKVGYCYLDQNNSIIIQDNLNDILTKISQQEKYQTYIDHRKKCEDCIARQICNIVGCPKNYLEVIENKGLDIWCNNIRDIRMNILKYLILGK